MSPRQAPPRVVKPLPERTPAQKVQLIQELVQAGLLAPAEGMKALGVCHG